MLLPPLRFASASITIATCGVCVHRLKCRTAYMQYNRCSWHELQAQAETSDVVCLDQGDRGEHARERVEQLNICWVWHHVASAGNVSAVECVACTLVALMLARACLLCFNHQCVCSAQRRLCAMYQVLSCTYHFHTFYDTLYVESAMRSVPRVSALCITSFVSLSTVFRVCTVFRLGERCSRRLRHLITCHSADHPFLRAQ